MENKGYMIAKLNGTNYFLWKLKLEMVLQKEKLWSVLEEDPPAVNIEEWRSRDQSARATIGLALDDKILITIVDCKTAKETWNRLKTVYEHSNITSKLFLLKGLYRSKYENHQNMEDYLNHIREITERLRAIGETVKEAHLIAVILCGLPESYSPLITALEAKEESDLTVEYVSEKLRDEAKRKESQNQIMDDVTMALASNHLKTANIRRNSIVCHRCGREGHIKRNCRLSDYSQDVNSYKQPKNEYLGNTNREKDTHHNYYSSDMNNYNDEEENTDHHQQEEWALSGNTEQNNVSTHTWIVDSGASSHMASDNEYITDRVILDPPIIIKLANGDCMKAVSKGNMIINVSGEEKITYQMPLNNVLIIPDLKHNLLAISEICKEGYTVEFEGKNCSFKIKSKIIAQGKKNGNIFVLDAVNPHQDSCLSCVHVWHTRLGHRNIQGIKTLCKDKIVKNLTISSCKHTDFCKVCRLGSMTQSTFKTSVSTSIRPFQLLMTDICGPITPTTFGNKKYLLTITDNYSNYTFVDMLSLKSEAANSVIAFLKTGYNKFQYWPEILRSDGGGEFCGGDLENFLKDKGVMHQTTIPSTPQQNGKSERKNRTIFNMVRCMLKGKGLPLELWGEAARTSVHILNRVQHADRSLTPHELWSGRSPNIGYFKEFGCVAFALIDKGKRSKLSDKAMEGRFVGYGIGKKGFRIWIPGTRRIINTISASFLEEGCTIVDPKQHYYSPPPNHLEKDFLPVYHDFCAPYDATTPDPIVRRSMRSNKGVPATRLTY